jgi:hypothetical protein
MTFKPVHAIILFAIVFLADAVIGNLLYMNPLVSGLYAAHAGHPGMKQWQTFGPLFNFIMMNMLAGLVLSAVYVVLFSLVRNSLPPSSILSGLAFGVLVILVKAAPEAWNQYLNINYPVKLILMQLINSSLSILLTGVILGLAWRKWPVFV